MALMLWDGKLLTVGGALAAHEDCCCGESEESCDSCYDFWPMDGLAPIVPNVTLVVTGDWSWASVTLTPANATQVGSHNYHYSLTVGDHYVEVDVVCGYETGLVNPHIQIQVTLRKDYQLGSEETDRFNNWDLDPNDPANCHWPEDEALTIPHNYPTNPSGASSVSVTISQD